MVLFNNRMDRTHGSFKENGKENTLRLKTRTEISGLHSEEEGFGDLNTHRTESKLDRRK